MVYAVSITANYPIWTRQDLIMNDMLQENSAL